MKNLYIKIDFKKAALNNYVKTIKTVIRLAKYQRYKYFNLLNSQTEIAITQNNLSYTKDKAINTIYLLRKVYKIQ